MSNPLQQSLIDEAAAGWAARRLGGDGGDEAGFARWLDENLAHAEAYDRAEATWRLIGEGAGTSDLLAARRDALARARRPKLFRPDRRLIAAGLLAAVAAPTAWWLSRRGEEDQLIQTALGEQRTLTLADGSRVTLDALTVMRVRYTPVLRSVDLVAGRAYFEVAKDASRPMRVRAGPRTVTALGTAFSVRREPRETTVVLAEGKVSVSNHESAQTLAVMHPGQTMVLGDGLAVGAPVAADLDRALAWRRGQVVLDNVALADAAAEMNHYSTLQVVVADARLRGLRVSGTFNAGDSAAFVEAVQSYFPVRVEKTATSVELHAAR